MTLSQLNNLIEKERSKPFVNLTRLRDLEMRRWVARREEV